jgi:hypothetical protein
MNRLEDRVFRPVWLVLDNEREVKFVEAMRAALQQYAPIQMFRNLIQQAAVMPIEDYYTAVLHALIKIIIAHVFCDCYSNMHQRMQDKRIGEDTCISFCTKP